MAGHDTSEAGLSPPESRRPAKALLVVLAALTAAILVVGTWWIYTADTSPAASPTGPLAGASTSAPATDADGAPVVAPGATHTDPAPTPSYELPPIPGAGIEDLATGWKKRWGAATKAIPRGYETATKLPATGHRVRFGALRSTTGTEATTLFCMATEEVEVDRRFLQAVVDACFEPALSDDERGNLFTWLTEQDYVRDVHTVLGLPRYNAELVAVRGSFSVRLVSRDRTGPGAVPTTRAGSAG
ncbi:hypothetical protein [Micromonospora sp. NPDC051296]|uniref:hypothetical protein n=1 Tax=Micromonospora sp. NPDC051296 TaxID=3155046 RepID=UPI003419BD65